MAGLIDDCSRRAFGELYDGVSSETTSETTRSFFEQLGVPIKSQTDGGSEFTNRYISLLNPRREKPPTQGAFEQLLLEYGVEHRITKPRTRQHNGKIERFNQTVLREFAAPVQYGLPLETYRRLFRAYLEYYNTRRRHSAIKYLTPMEAFEKYPPLAA
jgi:transposase InsO family protein